MHKFLRVCALMGFVCLLAVAGPLRAAPLKFPKEDAAFFITFPDEWKTTYPARDRLTAQPKGGLKMLCTVTPVTTVKDEAEARAAVPTFTEKFVAAAGIELKALRVSTPLNEFDTENGFTVFSEEWRGKNRKGDDVVVTVGLFAVEAGDYYAIVFVASPEADKATEGDQVAIVESISLDE